MDNLLQSTVVGKRGIALDDRKVRPGPRGDRPILNLAMFDIDGTLTATLGVDDFLFAQVFQVEFGLTGFSVDWGDYDHYTHGAIAGEILREQWGREPTPEEMVRLITCFTRLHQMAYQDDPAQYLEIPGAAETLKALQGYKDWEVAIASGGWRDSALMKLRAAGLGEFQDLPCAFCDEALTRIEIMELALKRAEERHGVASFDRVVYIGDGVWDVRASRLMGLSFIGLAFEQDAAALEISGARSIFPDLTDGARFRTALDEAPVPAPVSA